MEPPSESAERFRRVFCAALFASALAVHLFCASLGWHNPPVDGHEFRQAQTAITIRYLAQDGFSLAYPTPLLGKPWAIPLEFPLHQAIAAVVHRSTGLGVPEAGRLVSLLFFYAGLPALYLLARRLALDRWHALLVVSCVLASPLYLYYSRAVLIESTALALGLWFLWLHWCGLQERPAASLAAAAVGALAAMVKLPTFCAFLLPAALVSLPVLRPLQPAAVARAIFGTGSAFAAGVAWSAYADALKALNPLAATLQSGSQRIWATGELSLRLDPAFWTSVIATSRALLPGLAGLLALVAVFFLAGRRRGTVVLLLACFAAPPLAFANVYRIHDYYFFANAVFLLAAIGVGLGAATSGPRWRALPAWILLAALVPSGWHAYARGYHGLIPGNAHRRFHLPEVLRAATQPDDLLVIIGQDWNPVVPFLADRRALMIPFPREDDPDARTRALDNIAGERVGALVVTGPRRERRELYRPVIERFDLSREPVLSSPDDDIYLPRKELDRQTAGLVGADLGPFRLQAPAAVGSFRRRPAGDPARFPRMSPTPHEVAAQFGVAAYSLDGTTAVGAHPDCELVFAIPPGADRLRAGFGILPDAYRNPDGHTDGVQFTAMLEVTDGTSTQLGTRLLQPHASAADRGIAEFDLPLPAGATGNVVLRTDAGPAGNNAFDWAFWSFVRIE